MGFYLTKVNFDGFTVFVVEQSDAPFGVQPFYFGIITHLFELMLPMNPWKCSRLIVLRLTRWHHLGNGQLLVICIGTRLSSGFEAQSSWKYLAMQAPFGWIISVIIGSIGIREGLLCLAHWLARPYIRRSLHSPSGHCDSSCLSFHRRWGRPKATGLWASPL